MNFNKSLIVRNRHPLLQYSFKFCGFRTYKPAVKNSRICFRQSQSFEKHNNAPQPISFSLYSSLANEENIKAKNSNPVITIPSLHFEDLTFDQKVSHTELCAALHICDSVDEQMLTLASTLSLSPDDIENRIYFTKVMESLLKPFFMDIKIQIFGSTLNGFGFKGCDLDMSFEAFSDQKEQVEYLETPDVPLVSEVLSGKISPSEISSLPPKEQLIFIHSLLLEYYKESAEPILYINAHVPLVRFHHDKYGLKCDLTCRNKVAFANTKLLYLFGRLDERVIPMIMAIRYWAKYVELIGKGLMFNTYTITLLVIHFLQTRKDPILPSAEHLMSLSDSLEVQDMSDHSFLEIQRNVAPSKNTETLSELLKEFFLYYLYFDFTRVICPLIGNSVPREEFFKTCSKKFRMNSICIQDPMDVTHNVAELVEYKYCKKLFSEILAASWLLQYDSTLTPGPQKWGITCLFEKADENFNFKQYKWNKISFAVPLLTKKVSEDKDSKKFTAETISVLLNHVLLFECQPLNIQEMSEKLKNRDKEIERRKKVSEFKNKYNSELAESYLKKANRKINVNLVDMQIYSDALMLEEFLKFSLENELISCFECKTMKNTWLGRDHVSIDSLSSDTLNDLFEREHYISIETSKQNEQLAKNVFKEGMKKMEPFVFFCECYASPDFPTSLLLNFRASKISNLNPVLGLFLKEYLPKLIKNLNENC